MNASLSCSDLVGFYEFLVRKQGTFIEKALPSFFFAFGFLNFQGKGIFSEWKKIRTWHTSESPGFLRHLDVFFSFLKVSVSASLQSRLIRLD